MNVLVDAVIIIFAIWALCFVCALPLLAALMRSSQISRADENYSVEEQEFLLRKRYAGIRTRPKPRMGFDHL